MKVAAALRPAVSRSVIKGGDFPYDCVLIRGFVCFACWPSGGLACVCIRERVNAAEH